LDNTRIDRVDALLDCADPDLCDAIVRRRTTHDNPEVLAFKRRSALQRSSDIMLSKRQDCLGRKMLERVRITPTPDDDAFVDVFWESLVDSGKESSEAHIVQIWSLLDDDCYSRPSRAETLPLGLADNKAHKRDTMPVR
jgi:hypothetical protein